MDTFLRKLCACRCKTHYDILLVSYLHRYGSGPSLKCNFIIVQGESVHKIALKVIAHFSSTSCLCLVFFIFYYSIY